ncbi:MAG: UvrB/UvrC motif-containing protein, partial [bacterium]|nr:UvrB/UvrC motif-containing protein [bacterium]
SLMQVSGRAARNLNGKVIFYADTITQSMQKAIDETNRRRLIQQAYNQQHGITPTTIYKSVQDVMKATRVADEKVEKWNSRRIKQRRPGQAPVSEMEQIGMIEQLESEMRSAAQKLDFERAAELRDEIETMKKSGF